MIFFYFREENVLLRATKIGDDVTYLIPYIYIGREMRKMYFYNEAKRNKIKYNRRGPTCDTIL